MKRKPKYDIGGITTSYKGERYLEFTDFGTKSGALKMAKSLNKDGIKTRILKMSMYGRQRYVVLYRQKDWRKM
jgi:hypothetical protein